MAIDAKLLFSDSQEETTVAAHNSTNVLDLGSANPNNTGKLCLNITINTAVTSTGAATVLFALQDSADNSTYVQIWESAVIGKATLVKGKTYTIGLPVRCQRYLKVVYTIATAALSAGAWTADLNIVQVVDRV